jgi:hypothetical protein
MTSPAPEPAPPRPHRSAGKWIILLIVWSIGLVSWALYVAAAVYLLTRIL